MLFNQTEKQREINAIMNEPQYCPICARPFKENTKKDANTYQYFCDVCWIKISIRIKKGEQKYGFKYICGKQ